jgi:hypothetical protein
MPRYVGCIRLPLREYQFEEIARIAVAVPGGSDQEKRSLFKVERSQLWGRIALPAVSRLYECVPSPETRLVSTLSRVKALSALFSSLLRNPNCFSNLHMLAIIAWFKEPLPR